MLIENGFTFTEYIDEGYPAELAGLPLNTPITGINGHVTTDFQSFAEVLQCTSPGDLITVTSIDGDGNSADYELTLAENPDSEGDSFMGISMISNELDVASGYESGVANAAYNSLDWLSSFLRWLFILSLGIGLFNLLPLPIVDGGKMTQIFLHKWRGKVKGELLYHKISMVFLLVLIFSILFPLFQTMFNWVF